MKNSKLKMISIAVATALGITACGSGSDGTVVNSTADNSTASKSSSITGVITGFGSVFIDGVEYETDTANFTLDGLPGSEDNLAVGMVVTLQGTVNPDGTTGIASSITFKDEVEGSVLANNFLVDGTLDIMGQTIHIDDSTSLDSDVLGVDTFDQIAVGNVVEVSGFSSGTGTIYASRLEVKKAAMEAGDDIELKGVVSSLDSIAQTFVIGGLTVDYSSAQLEGMTEITDGLYVEAESHQGLSGSVMVASKIELEDGGDHDESGDDGEEMEFEGVIMSVDVDSVVVNGQTVYFTDQTEFEHGDVNSLVVGTKLKVEGSFDAAGKLIAEEFEFKDDGDTEITSEIESVDATAGTVNMLGLTFHIDNNTTMKDERDEGEQTPVRYFNIADVVAGDWAELRARYDEASSQWVATKLIRDDKEIDDLSEIEGVVEDNSVVNQLTVATITIDHSAVQGFSVNIGDKIEASGNFSNGVFTASEIELDD